MQWKKDNNYMASTVENLLIEEEFVFDRTDIDG